uniref:Uncharacterized protein n=1 Tax=Mustela putorius furo TaxID=9669 RepID=M3Y943_MUSPF
MPGGDWPLGPTVPTIATHRGTVPRALIHLPSLPHLLRHLGPRVLWPGLLGLPGGLAARFLGPPAKAALAEGAALQVQGNLLHVRGALGARLPRGLLPPAGLQLPLLALLGARGLRGLLVVWAAHAATRGSHPSGRRSGQDNSGHKQTGHPGWGWGCCSWGLGEGLGCPTHHRQPRCGGPHLPSFPPSFLLR